MSDAPAATTIPAPLALELEWQGGLRFRGTTGGVSLVLDSASEAGPTPVQALAFALAGCMAIDIVHILRKGRLEPRSLKVHLEAGRAPEDPKRLVSAHLHFVVAGDAPADKVERAIALSREKYCSVWHSLRPDIEFRASFEVA